MSVAYGCDRCGKVLRFGRGWEEPGCPMYEQNGTGHANLELPISKVTLPPNGGATDNNSAKGKKLLLCRPCKAALDEQLKEF